MRARVLAALVAIAMVGGAVVARQRMDDSGSGGSARGDGRGGDEIENPAATSIVCSSEITLDGCDAKTADGLTARTLASVRAPGDAPLAAWVAAGPWPQMVDIERRVANRPKLFDSANTVASTKLVVVLRERPAACAADVTWRCLGDAAQTPGGVRPALAAPATDTGTRLLLRAALVGAFIGDSTYASNDIDATAGALDWIGAAERGIEDGRSRGARNLADFLVTPSANAFVTTAAEAGAPKPGYEVVVPTPVVRVDAVLGVIGDRPDGVTDALRANGWAPPGRGDDGLPSPGVLLALRDLL